MSLVEVMVAVGVLAIGLSAGIGAIGLSSTTSIHNQSHERALAAIQDQVESFQAMTTSQINQQFQYSDNIAVDVPGLSPGRDPASGTAMSKPLLIQRIAQRNGTVQLTTLRFLSSWNDVGGDGWVEHFFYHTERR
jgi:Tfp pilus assembly protein PilV